MSKTIYHASDNDGEIDWVNDSNYGYDGLNRQVWEAIFRWNGKC